MYISSKKSKKLLMVNSYTYYYQKTFNNSGERWRCSAQYRGCKVNAYVKNDRISLVNGIHNHDPPRYVMTQAGQYIKI